MRRPLSLLLALALCAPLACASDDPPESPPSLSKGDQRDIEGRADDDFRDLDEQRESEK